MDQDLLRRFCTPPSPPLTDQDGRVLGGATEIQLPFDGESLRGYAWGHGKTVLLVHGWASRASHMALMGRHLSRSGFRAVAYDSPAHSSQPSGASRPVSNLFEYGRALSAVAHHLGPLHAVVGHSFGALCAVFTAARYLAFAHHRIDAEKLVLVSTPPNLARVLWSFCRRHGAVGFRELLATLEEGFDFSVDAYDVASALPSVSAEVLLVHDTDDEEFPLPEIRAIQEATPCARLFVTRGSGHQRILMSRVMMSEVCGFLTGALPRDRV